MAKVKGRVKAKVRRNGKPIKAGSVNDVQGGIFTAKIIAIGKKTNTK